MNHREITMSSNYYWSIKLHKFDFTSCEYLKSELLLRADIDSVLSLVECTSLSVNIYG